MFKQNLEKNFPTGLVRLNNKIFLHFSTLAKGSQTKKCLRVKINPRTLQVKHGFRVMVKTVKGKL